MLELPQYHDKSIRKEKLLLRNEQRKWFLEMKYTLVKML